LIRFILIWASVAAAIAVPMAAAAVSPQLEWRHPVYIAAGLAGIIALALLLVQPLLIGGYLPGLSNHGSRRGHRLIGGALVVAVLFHVGGLWITSPPDVIDALLFASPTPFSAWGVIAMWATFAAALLAVIRRRLRLRPLTWRIGHTFLTVIIVVGTVVHAMMIEGTMETVSKVVLCALVLVATLKIVSDLWVWSNNRHSAED
jgi:predicted ferric reductase